MRTAVLGMGRMGVALALRLLGAGHEVVVWNRSPGKAGRAVDAGAKEAGSVTDAVGSAEVVVVMLADDRAVRQVALGPGGIRSAIGDEATYVECSTLSPPLVAELAALFPTFVALPVLGAPTAVEAGTATYLAGGADAAVERVSPIVAAFGGQVRRYGSAPQASTAKVSANLLLLSGIVAMAEAFAVGRSADLSDDQLRELLSGAVGPGVKARFETVLEGPTKTWWTTVLGAKDAGLAVDAAKSGGVDLPVGQAVRDAFLTVAAEGHADEDIAAVKELYRKQD